MDSGGSQDTCTDRELPQARLNQGDHASSKPHPSGLQHIQDDFTITHRTPRDCQVTTEQDQYSLGIPQRRVQRRSSPYRIPHQIDVRDASSLLSCGNQLTDPQERGRSGSQKSNTYYHSTSQGNHSINSQSNIATGPQFSYISNSINASTEVSSVANARFFLSDPGYGHHPFSSANMMQTPPTQDNPDSALNSIAHSRETVFPSINNLLNPTFNHTPDPWSRLPSQAMSQPSVHKNIDAQQFELSLHSSNRISHETEHNMNRLGPMPGLSTAGAQTPPSHSTLSRPSCRGSVGSNPATSRRCSRRSSPFGQESRVERGDSHLMEPNHTSRDKGKNKTTGSLGNNSLRRHMGVTQSSRSSSQSIRYRESDLHMGIPVPAGQVYIPMPSRLLTSGTATSSLNPHTSIEPSLSRLQEPVLAATGTAHVTEALSLVNRDKADFFPGAHGFAISNFNVIHSSGGSARGEHSEALDWLRGSMLEGAEFDSADRDPPPRCHPGTRTSILQRANEWMDNPHRDKQLFWVRGPAGVGKSAIVQTLADTLSMSRRLGASLFFSRPNGRSDPKRVFPTLAYQFAMRNASYKAYINELMAVDPRPLEYKAMKEQFRLLVVEPFVGRKLRDGQGGVLVAIDGLDECDGDSIPEGPDKTRQQGRTLEEVHCEIVELISEFVQSHPSVPLIWIIASRPESHIKAVFLSSNVLGSYVEEDIPIDSDEACQDVEKFLHTSFTKIREKYSDRINDSPWPSNAQFLQIAKAASGLFVFAEVVIRFIGDPNVRKPISQLEYVLAAIANIHHSKKPRNPLSVLDAIYTAIVSGIPQDVWEVTRGLLQLLIYAHRHHLKVERFNFRNMYGCRQITQEDAMAAFDRLHSVIHFPRVKDIGKTRPRFYHASFCDYLQDPSRSDERAIKESTPDLVHYLPSMFGEEPRGVERIPRKQKWNDDESWELLRTILRSETLSPSGVTIKFLSTRHSIPDVRLQPMLEGLNFRKMALRHSERMGFLSDPTQTRADELQRRGILAISTLDSLGIPPSNRFCVKTGSFAVCFDFQHNETDDTCEEYHANMCRDGLRRLFWEVPKTKIWIWGCRDGEKCAGIHVRGLPEWWLSRHLGPAVPAYFWFITGFSYCI